MTERQTLLESIRACPKNPAAGRAIAPEAKWRKF
jgi:hypothetical protein